MRTCLRCGHLVTAGSMINGASVLMKVSGWTVRTKINTGGSNYHLVEADVGTVFCGPLRPITKPEESTP